MSALSLVGGVVGSSLDRDPMVALSSLAVSVQTDYARTHAAVIYADMMKQHRGSVPRGVSVSVLEAHVSDGEFARAFYDAALGSSSVEWNWILGLLAELHVADAALASATDDMLERVMEMSATEQRLIQEFKDMVSARLVAGDALRGPAAVARALRTFKYLSSRFGACGNAAGAERVLSSEGSSFTNSFHFAASAGRSRVSWHVICDALTAVNQAPEVMGLTGEVEGYSPVYSAAVECFRKLIGAERMCPGIVQMGVPALEAFLNERAGDYAINLVEMAETLAGMDKEFQAAFVAAARTEVGGTTWGYWQFALRQIAAEKAAGRSVVALRADVMARFAAVVGRHTHVAVEPQHAGGSTRSDPIVTN